MVDIYKTAPVFYDFKLTLDEPMYLMHSVSRQARLSPARPDIHYALHLGVLIKGQFVSGIRDYQQVVKPGQVWLTSPWEPHTVIESQANSELLLCTVLLEKLGDIGPAGRAVPWLTPFVLPPSNRPQTETKLQKEKVLAFAERLKNTAFNEDRIQADCEAWLALHELVLFLISIMPPLDGDAKTQNFNFTRILPVIEYLKKHHGQPLSIDEAAELCSLGKSRFCDLFKQVMGVSFGKYAIRSRLSGASAEMKNTQLSLKEIADKWGFYDESHFYRQFQQTFNCTPSQYRKK